MTEDAVAAIERGLAELGDAYRDAFATASNEISLRDEYAKVLGKKQGSLTRVMGLMRDVPADRRPEAGAKVNAFKDQVERTFERTLALADKRKVTL